MLAKKGDWVEIYNVVLESKDRAPQIPEDTKNVPLETWVKGFILEEGKIGDIVKIETVVGREVQGKLVKIHPTYVHNYGKHVPEILQIGKTLKEVLFEGEDK
jgi:hypothetical protein